MKTWKKIIIGFFAFTIFISVLQNLFPKDDKTPVKNEVIKPFNSFTDEEKRNAVNEFIFSKNYTDKRAEINRVVKISLSQSVKYPESLEYLYNGDWVDGSSTYVFNENNFTVDPKIKNRIYLEVDFRSENNFSQKVRNKFQIIFDFKGNEPYELVDAKILN